MLAFLLALISFGRIFTIPAGSVGVINQFGNVKDSVGPGMHVMGFGSGVTEITTRTQSTPVDMTASSKENTTVTYKVTTNWHIDPKNVMEFYKQYGDDDKERIDKQLIGNTLQGNLKTASTSFPADQQIPQQQEIRKQAVDLMKRDMEKYHIIVDDVIIEDQNFDKAYNDSFERQAIAKQEAITASFLKEKARNEADAKVIQASGSARVKVMEAEADAKAQELVRQSLTPEILRQQEIAQWDGHYPQYVLGSNSVPLIQLNK